MPALRLSGIYLALGTAAFATVCDQWFFTLPTFEVAGVRISLFNTGAVSAVGPRLSGWRLASGQDLMMLAAVFLALASVGVATLRRGRFGRRLIALRDSEAAYATLGGSLLLARVAVFALAAGIAGLGGALYAMQQQSVTAVQFSLVAGLPLFLLAVVGGLASVGDGLFTGVMTGGVFTALVEVAPWSANLAALLPALAGLGLGRNPDGLVPALRAGGYAALDQLTRGRLARGRLVRGRRQAAPAEPEVPVEWWACGGTGGRRTGRCWPVASLEANRVTVAFGGNRALDGVTVTAERGQVTGLIGPNGAGKSTLFDIVCGLRKPSSGQVLLDGRDVTRMGPARRARYGLARTFQRLELFGRLSVRDNLLVAAELGPERHRASRVVDDILTRLGLAEVAGSAADALPTGLGRLVEVGRALALHPGFFLLDEPAAGLGIADHAAVLVRGRVERQGRPDGALRAELSALYLGSST